MTLKIVNDLAQNVDNFERFILSLSKMKSNEEKCFESLIYLKDNFDESQAEILDRDFINVRFLYTSERCASALCDLLNQKTTCDYFKKWI